MHRQGKVALPYTGDADACVLVSVRATVFVRPRTTPSWILLELDRFDTMFATRWFASPLRLDDFRLYVVWEIFLLRSGNWESLRGNYVSRIWRIVRNDNLFFQRETYEIQRGRLTSANSSFNICNEIFSLI